MGLGKKSNRNSFRWGKHAVRLCFGLWGKQFVLTEMTWVGKLDVKKEKTEAYPGGSTNSENEKGQAENASMYGLDGVGGTIGGTGPRSRGVQHNSFEKKKTGGSLGPENKIEDLAEIATGVPWQGVSGSWGANRRGSSDNIEFLGMKGQD